MIVPSSTTLASLARRSPKLTLSSLSSREVKPEPERTTGVHSSGSPASGSLPTTDAEPLTYWKASLRTDVPSALETRTSTTSPGCAPGVSHVSVSSSRTLTFCASAAPKKTRGVTGVPKPEPKSVTSVLPADFPLVGERSVRRRALR